MLSKNTWYKILSAVVTAGFTIYLYYNIPQSFQDLDNRLRDFLFQYRGDINTTGKVAIADIDEKSLSALGQWPWNRKVIAHIIDNLDKAGASVIGLDMVFSEEDQRSDAYIIRKRNWKVEGITDPEDFDAILGDSMGRAHAVLGYVWNVVQKTPAMDETCDDDTNPKGCLPLPTTTITFNSKGHDSITVAKGVLPNLKSIQLGPDTVEGEEPSAGFFNNFADNDAIIRRVPLLMKKGKDYYPSLALEMFCRYKKINNLTMLYDDDMLFNGIAAGDLAIPTDATGRFLVNFRGPQHSYDYIPMVDIFNNTFDHTRVKDKLILIGTSAIGLLDIRATPLDTAYPGVEVHANIIDNLLKKDFLVISPNTAGQELLLLIGIIFLVALLMNILPAIWAILSVGILAIALFAYLYYSLFTNGLVLSILFPYMGMFIMTITSLLLSYILEGRTKELIKAKFAQKVSPDVVEELMKDPDSVNFAAMDKEVTVFFSDVRSFTTISEQMGSAEKLISLMNDYMTPMVDIILEEKGTIDKFIGDAIMAYWNAPKDLNNHQDHGVTSALRQILYRDELNRHIKPTYGVELDYGIGINTGVAVVGEMGSQGRSDYTLIGDPINLGARLEALCKPYGVRLIISEFTKAGLKKEYIIRDLDYVRVKGKELPVAIYEVLDFGEATGDLKTYLEDYAVAHALYMDAKFDQALVKFKALELEGFYPKEHKIHEIYIGRCEHYIEQPPVDFDGVWTHTTKS